MLCVQNHKNDHVLCIDQLYTLRLEEMNINDQTIRKLGSR